MKSEDSKITNLLEDKTSLYLFITLCLAWGFTWSMGKYQINSGILPELAVSYRFIAISFICFVAIKIKGQSLKLKKRDFKILLIYAIFCSSINFVLFYYAAGFMITSVSAIIYSFSIIIAALIKHLFNLAPEKLLPIFVSGGIGIIGLIFIMSQKFHQVETENSLLIGILIASLATTIYSIGSVFYERKKNHISLDYLPSFFYTAFFGSLITFGVALLHSVIKGEALNFLPIFSFSFIISYAYLVFSGFGILLIMILIHRIGIVRASYVNLITPVVAILVSSILEDYKITLSTIVGIVLIIASNYIGLFRKKL